MHEFRAPGRVNLIGGQVDFHEGLVVAMAFDRDVRVRVEARDDRRVVARSRDFDGVVDLAADGSDDPRTAEPAWGRLVGAVVRVLADTGRAPVGADLDVVSQVPAGSGLSSSAAFTIAVALALDDVADHVVPPLDLARAAQQAERVATGVPVGLQDHVTSVFGAVDQALLVDFRSLRIDRLPLPDEVRVVVVHSGVPRDLEHSPYAARIAESFAVAHRLGFEVLRDASLDQVRDEPRGRHAVTEIVRVREFADGLRRGDIAALGPLMLASHASSRDDMEVSIPELDALVDALVRAGALGARLTGGGFGGCVVALVPSAHAEAIAARATAEYAAATGRTPRTWITRAGAGAGAVDAP
jgi:galactokinase